jgi:hypothetical protein
MATSAWADSAESAHALDVPDSEVQYQATNHGAAEATAARVAGNGDGAAPPPDFPGSYER